MDSQINIPIILETEAGSTGKIGAILKQHHFKEVACFMGNGLYDLFGKKIIEGFSVEPDISLVVQEEYESTDIFEITKKALSLPKSVECIIGIGGGKAIDCAKYMAFLLKKPFISVPTSISNDGFSSSNASLMVDGKRTSVGAVMPYGIIADLEILESAPERFYYSGLGDIISKITAIYDWELEDRINPGTLNHFAAMMSKKSVNSVVRMPFSYIREPLFIKEVVDSLIMSGIAMEIAGNSAPASGSEHQISHAMDQYGKKTTLHGIQVGVATYIMAGVQQHRFKRVDDFLTATGFFGFIKGYELLKSDFELAINKASTIKPGRHTYINNQKYRDEAIKFLHNDKKLQSILR